MINGSLFIFFHDDIGAPVFSLADSIEFDLELNSRADFSLEIQRQIDLELGIQRQADLALAVDTQLEFEIER